MQKQDKNFIQSLLPSLKDYSKLRTSWKSDLMAGLTVGIVALPLALGFGVSSGVGPAAGLVTAVIAGIVAAVFGGSHVQVSGPTGAMAVVLAPIVAVHGVRVVPIIAIIAGGLVALAGIFRLGRTVTFIPWPVVEGFTLGIAIIIFLQQVPLAIGTESDKTNTLLAAIDSVNQASSSSLHPLLITAIAMAISLLLPKLHSKLPASLLAVILSTLLAKVLHLEAASIGTLPHSLPVPAMPGLSPELISTVFSAALSVAALAAIESLLSARVAATMQHGRGYHPDRELFGQGLASVASGMFGGLPATGAIARTAVNVRAGAETRFAAITHSIVIIAVIYLASGLVSQVPLAALAGVLMATTFRMVSKDTLFQASHSGKLEALVFASTAIVTVTVDLIRAVEFGVVIAGVVALYRLSASSQVIQTKIPNLDSRVAVFQIDGALFFGTADRISDEITEAKGVKVIVLRFSHLRFLDTTGAATLNELLNYCEERQITVLLKGIQPRHLRTLKGSGAWQRLESEHHIFENLEDAVNHAKIHLDNEETLCK